VQLSAAGHNLSRAAVDRHSHNQRQVEAPAAGTMQHGRRHLAPLRAAVFSRETADDDVRGGVVVGGGYVGSGRAASTAGDGGRSATAAADARLDGRRATPGGSDDLGTDTGEAVRDIAQHDDASWLTSLTCIGVHHLLLLTCQTL